MLHRAKEFIVGMARRTGKQILEDTWGWVAMGVAVTFIAVLLVLSTR